MNHINYVTEELCMRCGGDGYDPDDTKMELEVHYGELFWVPFPDRCRNCLGHGKLIDWKLYSMYEEEYFSITYGI